MLLEEGAFWSEPRDTEHWRPAVNASNITSARDFIKFAEKLGFPSGPAK